MFLQLVTEKNRKFQQSVAEKKNEIHPSVVEKNIFRQKIAKKK